MDGWGRVLILRFWNTRSDWESLHYCTRGKGCTYLCCGIYSPSAGSEPNREKRLQPKLLGLFQLKWDQEASVLAAGMKGNMLLVTQTGIGTVFSHRVVLYYDKKYYIFHFSRHLNVSWEMAPEGHQVPQSDKSQPCAGRQDQRCPGGVMWHGPYLDSKGLWESLCKVESGCC